MENMRRSRPYFNGKNRIDGYKIEASVLPNRICIYRGHYCRGGVSDITVFRDELKFQR